MVALYVYLVPFFRPLALAPAFLIFLFMSYAAPGGFFLAVYGGVTLALILGIKDLVIVNRRGAYQVLTLLLSLAGCLLLFGTYESWSSTSAFMSLALAALLWFWLLRNVPEKQENSILPPAIAALIFFEIGAAMFFLPISFFVQAILLFLASALLFEAAIDPKAITFRKAFVWGGAYAAIALLLVFLASWEV